MLRRLALCALALVAMPATAQEDGAGVIELPPDVPGEARLVGPITPTTGDELRAALEQPAGVLVLVLDSPGGSITGALAVAALVREAGIAAYVPYDGDCHGACALVLLAGTERGSDGNVSFGLLPGTAEEQAAAQDYVGGLGLPPGIVRLFNAPAPVAMGRQALYLAGIAVSGARLAPRHQSVVAFNLAEFYAAMLAMQSRREDNTLFSGALSEFDSDDLERARMLNATHQAIASNWRYPARLIDFLRSELIFLPDLPTEPFEIVRFETDLIPDLILRGAERLLPDEMVRFLALFGGFMTALSQSEPALCAAWLEGEARLFDVWERFFRHLAADDERTDVFAWLAGEAADAELQELSRPTPTDIDPEFMRFETWSRALDIVELGERYGLRPGPPAADGPDPGGGCRRLGVMFELFASLPEPQRSATVRFSFRVLRDDYPGLALR